MIPGTDSGGMPIARRKPVSNVAADSFEVVAPRASSLIESLRAFSYNLPSAIADLVDNSVTAEAEHIWIDFYWDGEQSTISVTDDGHGMSEEQLVAAMRPGSRSPLEERDTRDLGRFGLGMKTASFSQCRRVTVRSKRLAGPAATRCWDLDHIAEVDQWQLLRSADPRTERFMHRLDSLPHGTTVVWQKLDRVTGGHDAQSEDGQRLFLERAADVHSHLSMVFHDLMRGRGAIKLHLNERRISGWDPFLADHPATQVLPVTKIPFRDSGIELQPFILPHHSKLTDAEFKMAGGSRGWNAHQGFYVYRRRRLLVAGDWLNLGWAKEEHYKLARIKLEFPNALDLEWGLDVTKSRAFPPAALRGELRAIAERTRKTAKLVYTFRGAQLTARADRERIMLWKPVAKHDRLSYRLNREHPVLKRVVASTSDRDALATLLRLIEETIPHAHVTIQSSEKPTSLQGPFEHAGDSQIRDVMRHALRCLVASGYSAAEAAEKLATLWPFELFPALLQTLVEQDP